MGRKTQQNQITSPELLEQINPKNIQLVERFFKNFRTKRSPNSVKSYQSNFDIFFTWNLLHNNDKSFIDIKKIELMDFFDHAVEEWNWSGNRYAQVWSSLSSLSNFVENYLDEIYPDFKNLVKRIEKIPKEPVREKSVFTQEEMNSLMDWLDSQELYQECCLLSLILSSGARISELNRFNIDIIDLDNTAFDGLFIETLKEQQVKGRGVNGKKIRRYLIKDIFESHYLKWLPIREKIMKDNNQEHNSLFVKKDGTPAVVGTFRSWMKKWNEQLSKPWYAHAGRHYWCTFCIASGLDPALVQELQDWSTDALVKLYDDSTAKDKKWKGLDKFKENLEQTLQI